MIFPNERINVSTIGKASFYRQKCAFLLLERPASIIVKTVFNELYLSQWKYYRFPYRKYQFTLVETCFKQCKKYCYIK